MRQIAVIGGEHLSRQGAASACGCWTRCSLSRATDSSQRMSCYIRCILSGVQLASEAFASYSSVTVAAKTLCQRFPAPSRLGLPSPTISISCHRRGSESCETGPLFSEVLAFPRNHAFNLEKSNTFHLLLNKKKKKKKKEMYLFQKSRCWCDLEKT